MQATNNQIDLPQDDLMSFSAIFCNRPPSGRASDEQRRTFLKVYPGGYSLIYRYVQPQRVGFVSRFGHKLGIDFGYFAAILVIDRVTIFAL